MKYAVTACCRFLFRLFCLILALLAVLVWVAGLVSDRQTRCFSVETIGMKGSNARGYGATFFADHGDLVGAFTSSVGPAEFNDQKLVRMCMIECGSKTLDRDIAEALSTDSGSGRIRGHWAWRTPVPKVTPDETNTSHDFRAPLAWLAILLAILPAALVTIHAREILNAWKARWRRISLVGGAKRILRGTIPALFGVLAAIFLLLFVLLVLASISSIHKTKDFGIEADHYDLSRKWEEQHVEYDLATSWHRGQLLAIVDRDQSGGSSDTFNGWRFSGGFADERTTYDVSGLAHLISDKPWVDRYGLLVGPARDASSGALTGLIATSPIAYFIIFAGILPALWLSLKSFRIARAIRARRRRATGRCTACGYDLRGSGALCPECGTLSLNALAGAH